MPGFYSLEFRSVGLVGSCPASGITGPNIPSAVAAIMASDSYTQLSPQVISGSCVTTTLIVRNVQTGSIVSQSSVQVSNL